MGHALQLVEDPSRSQPVGKNVVQNWVVLFMGEGISCCVLSAWAIHNFLVIAE